MDAVLQERVGRVQNIKLAAAARFDQRKANLQLRGMLSPESKRAIMKDYMSPRQMQESDQVNRYGTLRVADIRKMTTKTTRFQDEKARRVEHDKHLTYKWRKVHVTSAMVELLRPYVGTLIRDLPLWALRTMAGCKNIPISFSPTTRYVLSDPFSLSPPVISTY